LKSVRPPAALAERLTAQGLSGAPLADPAAVAERLLAVQGQDPRGFRLAVRARTEGLHAADVERALAERALKTIEDALAEGGPLTRVELRERLDAADVRTEGQAMIHLLFLAAVRGLVVRGPMAGKQHAYVLAREWLGEPKPLDREKALAELARRYLVGHQPATDRDLAKWAGLPLRDARAGLEAIAAELEQGEDGLLRLAGRSSAGKAARRRATEPLPPPRLLGAFDPVLLGWTSREDILGPHTTLVTRNGMFHPFAMAGGRAVAKWGLAGGRLAVEPLERLPKAVAVALEGDAADVTRFLGA
jgi:hypothetical protein